MAQVLHSIDGHVATIVLSNEAKYNAMTLGMWVELGTLLGRLREDEAVRVVVLRGQGEKAFVSGADISEFEKARNTPEQVAYYDKIGEEANRRLNKCSKPTIARIRGYCIGGGLAVSLLCDIRIASENSRFGVPAARLGLGYRASGLKILTDLVGPSHAKEIFFTARHFNAQEAFGMGLVTRVVPDAELDSYVDEYCRMIGENAPLTMHAAKRTIEELTRLDGEPDFARLNGLVKQCFDSEDYIEGRTAFMEKRKPVFKGR
jgi:enoyl-CoA hydratase/carnithine racemase